MTGLYVEHNIGPDARRVGERILERVLRLALEGKEKEVRRLVEVDNHLQHGLLRVCEDERCEVLVTGASRIFEIGERGEGVSARVARGTDQPTIVVVRGTVPRRARTLRWLDYNVQRLVPQLNHDDRLGVVERIQTNAQWTFDYILLLGLATLIAAMGLLADSVAVIIGAMLIAPLMTPLIGLGLAITQGNLKLAHITLKALGLGVLTSFVFAAAVGLSDIDFHVSTTEMLARHWPGELDLIIAFAGGLAAAYAYGRPGLLAALPGVAISAAVLPPIATSGLALTIHDYDLAIGAMLLFVVNMVAITLAAALSLWAVGFRYAEKSPQSTRILGMALTVTLIVMVLGLPLTEPHSVPPTVLVEAVEEALDDKLRLRRIYLKHEPEGLTLQVNLGGSHMPSRELGEQLRDLAEEHLGESGGVRLTFRYETLIQ